MIGAYETYGPKNIVVKYDYNTYEKNNYTSKPPTFSGESIDFK